MDTVTVLIPNVLGGSISRVERLFSALAGIESAGMYGCDMRMVDFVRPYGVVALALEARRLSIQTGQPVRLLGLQDQVHLYLHRIDLFDVCSQWLESDAAPDEAWARSPQTPNLLELTRIAGPNDVTHVLTRAESIFSRWLVASNLRSVLGVLSELCANIYQHSRDPCGLATIQKYESGAQGQVIVCVSVGDSGCGIRGSLVASHGEFGREPLDYLRAAMQGRTSRVKGRGGLGLRRVEEIVGSSDGSLWIRSESAGILSRRPRDAEEFRDLTYVAGTQVAVELRAPLRI